MKLTLRQIVNGSQALERLGQKSLKVLTTNVYHDLSRDIRLVQPELELFNNVRNGLIEKYSEETPTSEGGSIWGVPSRNVMALNIEIEKVLQQEVSIEIHPIHLTDEIIEKADISANDLYLLGWMIELPEEK